MEYSFFLFTYINQSPNILESLANKNTKFLIAVPPRPFQKEASINYVSKILPIFDPLPLRK